MRFLVFAMELRGHVSFYILDSKPKVYMCHVKKKNKKKTGIKLRDGGLQRV